MLIRISLTIRGIRGITLNMEEQNYVRAWRIYCGILEWWFESELKPIIPTVSDAFVLKSFRRQRKQSECCMKNIQINSVGECHFCWFWSSAGEIEVHSCKHVCVGIICHFAWVFICLLYVRTGVHCILYSLLAKAREIF